MTYNGARGWINIPFLPFSLQPAEFLKGAFIIFIAYFLKKKRKDITFLKEGFMPFLAILGIIIVLL